MHSKKPHRTRLIMNDIIGSGLQTDTLIYRQLLAIPHKTDILEFFCTSVRVSKRGCANENRINISYHDWHIISLYAMPTSGMAWLTSMFSVNPLYIFLHVLICLVRPAKGVGGEAGSDWLRDVENTRDWSVGGFHTSATYLPPGGMGGSTHGRSLPESN